MSFKLIILLVVALAGFQAATGFYLDDLENLDAVAEGPLGHRGISLFAPVHYPVTFLGRFMHLRPVKYAMRIVLFPLTAFLRIMKIVLTPLRVLLFPVHILYYAFLFVMTPIRYFGRFILNGLLLLPIISYPTRVLVAGYRFFSFPSAAITSTVTYLLGPSWMGYFREFLDFY